jgi:signal transduction histidine kinase
MEGAARPMPAGVSLALYRIAQEALTNIRKHAGPGAAAEMMLRCGLGEAVITVADDGGAPVASSRPRFGAAGHGLAGMRDRVGVYGGTLAAGPRAGGGFEVTARLPLPATVSMTGDAA